MMGGWDDGMDGGAGVEEERESSMCPSRKRLGGLQSAQCFQRDRPIDGETEDEFDASEGIVAVK